MKMIPMMLIAVSIPALAFAQHAGHPDASHAAHDSGMQGMSTAGASAGLTESGNAGFGAIQEVVTLLESRPDTDWSRVDIEGLRQHLIDMDQVMMDSEVSVTEIPGGARYDISGTGRAVGAIQRMVGMHSSMMNGTDGITFSARETANGAIMEATGENEATTAKIRGLGFAGLMAMGDHHQTHHEMMAEGGMSH